MGGIIAINCRSAAQDMDRESGSEKLRLIELERRKSLGVAAAAQMLGLVYNRACSPEFHCR